MVVFGQHRQRPVDRRSACGIVELLATMCKQRNVRDVCNDQCSGCRIIMDSGGEKTGRECKGLGAFHWQRHSIFTCFGYLNLQRPKHTRIPSLLTIHKIHTQTEKVHSYSNRMGAPSHLEHRMLNSILPCQSSTSVARALEQIAINKRLSCLLRIVAP